MLDRELGEALLNLSLTPAAEAPTAQIEQVIEAGHRRVTRWARLSITLWSLAALGGIGLFILGALTFPAIAKMLSEQGAGTLEKPDTPLLMLSKLVAVCMVVGTATAVVLVCAGLSTVVLLSRSRAATLRQINANLLVISRQLREKSK